ncbi:MAG: OprO/OprP family phosphate-selective porin [Planctomycetaceae bacterium]
MEKAWAAHQQQLADTLTEKNSSPTLELGGRIHADYLAFPETSPGIGFFEHPDPTAANFGVDPEDRFGFRRIRLEMEGDALATMYWRMQVDFAEPDETVIKDVYLGFRELPGDQRLQVGFQKRPLGLDALNSSRFNVFLERPFNNDAFNEDARRLGLLIQGNPRDERYLWQYGVYSLENFSASGSYAGDAYQLSGNARLASSPWYDEHSGGRNYFHWGLAGMIAQPDGDADAADSNGNEARFRARPEAHTGNRWVDTGDIAGAEWYEILAFESMLNLGPLQLVGEYHHTWLQRDVVGAAAPDLQFDGWYVYANYVLTGEHIPYERSSGTIGRLEPHRNFGLIDRCYGGPGRGWGAWGVGIRYSMIDLNNEDVLGGVGAAWTLAVNWYWTPYARLQFNVVSGQIDDRAPVGGFTSGHYTILGTRAAIDF